MADGRVRGVDDAGVQEWGAPCEGSRKLLHHLDHGRFNLQV